MEVFPPIPPSQWHPNWIETYTRSTRIFYVKYAREEKGQLVKNLLQFTTAAGTERIGKAAKQVASVQHTNKILLFCLKPHEAGDHHAISIPTRIELQRNRLWDNRNVFIASVRSCVLGRDHKNYLLKIFKLNITSKSGIIFNAHRSGPTWHLWFMLTIFLIKNS